MLRAEIIFCLSYDLSCIFREWLEAQPGLISSVVYTYLSIIPCYVGQTFSNLREQTAHMCVNFIRTRVGLVT